MKFQMNKTLLYAVIFFTQLGVTKDLSAIEKGDRASLSIRFSNYAIKTPNKMRDTILDDIEKLGSLELTEKNDLELVKNALLTLMLFDKMDVPRIGLSTLADNYGKHKALYKTAAAIIETEKNKKLLKELLEIMDSFDEQGNG